ncbi:M15 family peptidase [Nocardioides cavernaquae]|uniref:M15 family peptidase n=1 Tax=Nocardioides cavernaquae TaxID=2321396 RepID=A0A3A5HB93_9ACTN|nr:M15 family peptidase [Nocardioides cavernaquae]
MLREDGPPPAPASPGAPATGGTPSAPAAPTPSPTGPAAPSAPAPPAPGTVAPAWLGKRPLPETADGFGEIQATPRVLRNRRFTLPDTLPMLPGDGFASHVVSPAPADVIARSTWVEGCPVSASDLAWVQLAFRGFDGARHTGELLVNADVAQDMVKVFRQLWRAKFPLEEMRVTRRDELDAAPTGDGNNTSAFVCRPSVGSTHFSQHAYGLAVDVNQFQNPYTKGDLVLPELASAYIDRTNVRPGMILTGGPVIRAFASVGWEWGGYWNSLKDRHHFSLNNR